FFFFTAPTPTQTYTPSLHDALPILEEIHAAREQVLVHPLRALVRHFDDVDAGERGDDGRADVLAGAGTAGADVELAGIRPRERRSEEHTSELQSLRHLVCRLLLEKK